MPEKTQRSENEKLGPALRGVVEKGVEELGLANMNYVKEALTWQYNWIGRRTK